MRRLTLTEYQVLEGVDLTSVERDRLRTLAPSIAISPTIGRDGSYDLSAGSWIGAVHLGDLELVIRPKLPIDKVMFMISYAVGQGRWEESPARLQESDSLVEAILPGFTYQLRRVLARGVLQGYRTEEDVGAALRGRWRVADQVRRHFGIAPPLEITFDEYTEDIELNRLLRAAIAKLLRLPVRDPKSGWGLRAIDAKLADVALVGFDPHRVPTITYNRLTERYRPAVELARLILASTSFDLHRGDIAASAFLIDMNKVFEDFVVVALRESLGVTDKVLVQNARHRSVVFDQAGRVALLPDITIWSGSVCTFIGDVKYKRVRSESYPNADIYQLAAYTIAADLPSGMLIYAAGEDEPAVVDIKHIGKRLEMVALDLSSTPDQVLGQVAALGARIHAESERQAAVA